MAEEQKLSFLGHVRELRNRLMWSALAILIAVPIGYFLTDKYLMVLINVAPGTHLIYTEVTEMLGTYIKFSLLIAFVLALPFIMYQLVMFVRPALNRNERTYLYTMLPAVFILFICGAVFAYFILLPPAVNFLLTFHKELASPMIKIGNYMSIVTKLIFWIGICFEIPLVMFFLTKIGILKPEMLTKFRKFAVILAFVIGAVITPTMDPINQSLVAVPIIILYEIGILLSKIARGKKKKAEGSV
jgi:sec-independent protein translocase protein TatC